MKRISFFIFVVFIVAALPIVASAQFSPGLSLGNLPWNLGTSRTSCDPCDPAPCGWFNGYVGWMESSRNVTFSFDPAAGGSETGGSHRWRMSGVWIGAEKQICLNDKAGLFLDAWYLFPIKRSSTEQEEFTRTVIVFINEQPVVLTTSGVGGRTFDTRPEWWFLDAAGTYEAASDYHLMGGFRYEHFSVRFNNAGPGVGIPSGAGEESDLTVNSYIPYVGVQTVRGGSSGKLALRFIGFPWVPARVTHFETGEAGTGIRTENSGHFSRAVFCELFANFDRNIGNNMGIGAFFRWNYLRGKASLNTEVIGIGSADTEAVLTRNTYTVGASISLAFAGL